MIKQKIFKMKKINLIVISIFFIGIVLATGLSLRNSEISLDKDILNTLKNEYNISSIVVNVTDLGCDDLVCHFEADIDGIRKKQFRISKFDTSYDENDEEYFTELNPDQIVLARDKYVEAYLGYLANEINKKDEVLDYKDIGGMITEKK